MPDYQMPGRNEIANQNDGYAKRIPKESAMAKSGAAAMGITEGSKLYSASRKGSDHEAASNKS